ncbi:MAG: DUF1338 domain-containing protein [Marinicella pacifica]
MVNQFFEALWQQYMAITPQAAAIHQLLAERGEQPVNDHVALRTFGTDKLGLKALIPLIETLGYRVKGDYEFTAKNLTAVHFEHQDDPNHPKIFLSQLNIESLPDDLQAIVAGLDAQVAPEKTGKLDFLFSGRPWVLSFADYIQLLQVSEYAAWTAAFGYRANHFTVSINHLLTFFEIEMLNTFLLDQGFQLNESGGQVKGTPEQLLEQSSTLADMVHVKFSDTEHTIPGCFYEFAKRYPQSNGRLYQGFIAASADKIFESTDSQKPV